ncbi:CHAP domain-containing protein [Nonomuraea recticatena]|uniref:CHAP domain-containing protein n=1 Tax=Nonomuraea recticatena TaxID=46178 RepID=UPI003613FC08
MVEDSQYRNAPWCDMFISWAAQKAGVQEFVGQFAWTPSHAAWFIKQGAWSQRPEPGALVFYDWKGGKSYKGIDHVGIVEKVVGSKIHTIEANVDRVWLKRKVRDTEKVVGYGLPRMVKERPGLIEVRPSEKPAEPFAVQAALPGLTVEQQGSPFDVLGTPQALLAAMVLTTVVVSFRVAGRSRGSGRHRRGLVSWLAHGASQAGTALTTSAEAGPVKHPRATGVSGNSRPAGAAGAGRPAVSRAPVPSMTGVPRPRAAAPRPGPACPPSRERGPPSPCRESPCLDAARARGKETACVARWTVPPSSRRPAVPRKRAPAHLHRFGGTAKRRRPYEAATGK